MRLPLALHGLVLYLSTLSLAAKLTVSLPPSPPLLANPSALPPTTHATLLGAPGVFHTALLTTSNTLTFAALAPGSYLLNVYTRDYTFPPFRVDVSLRDAASSTDDPSSTPGTPQEMVEVWQTFRSNEWSNKGQKFGEGAGEAWVEVRPSSRKAFYQERGGFNLLGFFKSPMILMAMVSMAMVFGFPYLMDNMDPETKAEFDEMSRKSPVSGSEGAAAQLQNFDLAAWMAGKGAGASETPKGKQ